MKKLLALFAVIIVSVFGYHFAHTQQLAGGSSGAAATQGTTTSAYLYSVENDKTLTPGATNPNITQANISQNICNTSWSTKSIRPAVSYTTPLKIKQIGQYGYADTNTKDYEEDHLISLELGGSPTDPNNLWPEPYNISLPDGTPVGAHQKDQLENALHSQVCSGALTLDQAQTMIRTDWVSAWEKYVQKGSAKPAFGGTGAPSDDDDNG